MLGGGGDGGGDGDGVCASSNCVGGGADNHVGVSHGGDFGLVVVVLGLTTFGTIGHDGGGSEDEGDEEEEEIE